MTARISTNLHEVIKLGSTNTAEIPPQEDLRELLYKRLFFAVAPVSERVKPAVLYNLNTPVDIRLWKTEKGYLLKKLSLNAFCVYEEAGFLTLLLYRKELLEKHLMHPSIDDFLHCAGYRLHGTIGEKLCSLKQRYSITEYPHEIGVFLGYPLGDVCGFIQNKGKNYKLCKYWKVYDDVQHSQRLFAQIDRAKTNAMQSLSAAGI